MTSCKDRAQESEAHLPTFGNGRLSLPRRMLDAALAQAGYQRVKAAAAVHSRTFETSDAYDVPVGSRMFDRTLPAYKAQNLNKLCWEAYKRNPIIWGTVELVVRATVGKESRIQHNKLNSENATERAVAEKVQPVLERWWYSAQNDWPSLAESVQRDMVLFGELVPVMLTSATTGDVEIGFIDVNSIKEIVRDPLNIRRIKAIRVQLEGGRIRDLQLVRTYDGGVIQRDQEGNAPEWFKTWERVAAPKLVDRLIGEVFYWTNNRTLSSLRGQGDFAQVIDPATDAVRIVKGITDRITLNNRVWSEITFPSNWTQEMINDALDPTKPEYIKPPRLDDDADDLRLFGHSEGIKWEFKAPNIAAGESKEVYKMTLSLYSSGSNIPLHWMGWADELTYASAKDISNLPVMYLRDRQTSLKKFLRDPTDFQLDQWRIFTHELDGVPEELIYDYDFIMPQIDTRSLQETATIMKIEVDTLLAAKMAGAVDDESVADGIRGAMKKGGLNQ